MSPSHSCASDHDALPVSATVNHTSLPPPALRYEPVPAADPRTQAPGPSSGSQDVSPQSPTRTREVRVTAEASPDESKPVYPSPLRLPMPHTTPAQLALSAMQFLPVPLLVLSDLKTVVLANEAMGRLLGMVPETATGQHLAAEMDRVLLGQSLSQVGVDMAREGRPVWVDWEKFLDSLATRMGPQESKASGDDGQGAGSAGNGTSDMTTTTGIDGPPSNAAPPPSRNAVVEVIISRKDINKTAFDVEAHSHNDAFQICANMIVTVWEVGEGQTYFTLTFAIAESHHLTYPLTKVASAPVADANKQPAIPISISPSVDSGYDSNSASYRLSPSSFSLASSPFLPLGTPSMSSVSSAPSVLQKIIVMKDALLDSIQTPVFAMWKDGSVAFPNRGNTPEPLRLE